MIKGIIPANYIQLSMLTKEMQTLLFSLISGFKDYSGQN